NPNKILTQDGEKRLNAIREFTEFGSGFRVAMRDLEIRGTGNILGAEQSGHMASVGYDLYVKMINEAISEMQGNTVVQPVQTKIDIKLDAYLPVEYIQADSMRIEMYKRIAEIRDEESKEDVINELIDRFGDPGKAVMNLISISYIKALCEKLGISNISQSTGTLVMKFSQEAQLDPIALMKAVSEDKRLKFVPRGTGILNFTEPKADTEKLVTSCIKALKKLNERLDKEAVKEVG
ncbi:MAG: transcription-repair coupling factor, partial [Clostridia bacterium]|nr:transcription-repair coupling factor [Clostridia bacterium]